MSIADAAAPHFNPPLPVSSLLEGAPPSASAVSWGAVFAGAIAAAALSLILLFLGSGFGFGALSPWAGKGLNATAWAISAIAWLTFTQLAASALGGYLTGRLRTRWLDTEGDEIYFRDTAHGFLSWAVATLLTAGLLASAVGAAVNTGAQVGAAAVTTGAVATGAVIADARGPGAARNQDDANGMGYLVDSLFRKEATPNAADSGNGDASRTSTAEAARIFANAARSQALPPQDVTYLGQLVAQRSGLAQADAEKRVNETFAKLQAQISNAEASAAEAAEKARKASSYTALWLFISLLAGAFVASLAATFGGRQRDVQNFQPS